MFSEPVESDELTKLITNLNVAKSPGVDNFTPKLIKERKAELTGPLIYLHVYNFSLKSGTVPGKQKIAKVIPVYKKGDPQSTSNYTPISLLSIFKKLLKKIMHKRLYSFLTANKILYQYVLFLAVICWELLIKPIHTYSISEWFLATKLSLSYDITCLGQRKFEILMSR